MMNCSQNHQSESSRETKYFRSWTGYMHPIKPKGEIPKPDQSTSGIYYKAAYQDGLLKTFEKIDNGKSEYIFRYDYDADGRFLRHKVPKKSNKKSRFISDAKASAR